MRFGYAQVLNNINSWLISTIITHFLAWGVYHSLYSMYLVPNTSSRHHKSYHHSSTVAQKHPAITARIGNLLHSSPLLE